MNDRNAIFPLELDVYMPGKNIAIELDGLHWHSIGSGMTPIYHLYKTQLCESKGIRLIHIFEDEWRHKPLIVKSRLQNILGVRGRSIYARECEVVDVPIPLKNKFLSKYHLQGTCYSTTICLGLRHKGRLVSLMTFGSLRKALGRDKVENGYELIRFASVKGFNVTGAAGKLMSHFVKRYNPSMILSYADRRWSQGGLYNTLGFKLVNKSKPGYWYVTKDKSHRIHRYHFAKHKLVAEGFDPAKSEWEIMKERGYGKIYDCGTLVFEWTSLKNS